MSTGVFAKTFPLARHLVITTDSGPSAKDVQRRSVRTHTAGRVIDDCVVEETPEEIRLYAPVYDRLHFADDVRTLSGKYRCLCIHKLSQQVVWEINPELEQYNLDFPVKFQSCSAEDDDDDEDDTAEETWVILRNIDDQTHIMNGFVICHGLQIVKKLLWENRTVLGEPVVVRSRENNPLLLFFAVSNHTTCLVQYDLVENSLEEIPLNMPFTMGFHSFFLSTV